jgi:hypothetical protein
MQLITSLSLIAILLACPHLCRWQSLAAEAAESPTPPACPCCPKRDQHAPRHDQDSPPADCICKGAVSVAVHDTPTIDVEQPTGWIFDTAIPVAATSFDHSAANERFAGHSLATTGRAMRLLMASLRI